MRNAITHIIYMIYNVKCRQQMHLNYNVKCRDPIRLNVLEREMPLFPYIFPIIPIPDLQCLIYNLQFLVPDSSFMDPNLLLMIHNN